MIKKITSLFLILMFCFLFISGCDKSDSVQQINQEKISEVEVAEEKPTKVEINWFKGSVDEVFTYAKSVDKPIFLYWGAVWCPPCQQVRTTIFTQREFIEKTQLFVPVYLDGDAEGAQRAGERFQVLGYPTIIVFSSVGEEIIRLPEGIDVKQFNSVLDMALKNMHSIETIVQNIIESNQYKDDDFRLLAFHSWEQDFRVFENRDKIETLKLLYEKTPEHLIKEKSRLFLNYALAVFAEEAAELNEEDLAIELSKVLADPKQVLANFSLLAYNTEKLLSKFSTQKQQQLMNLFSAAFATLYQSQALSKREQLMSLLPKITISELKQSELSSQFKEQAVNFINELDQNTRNPYERQAVISMAVYVLGEIERSDLAEKMLIKELEISKTPFYFMPKLADFAKKSGNTQQALTWLRDAYDKASGEATRFQWGTYYLAGLLELTPEEGESIKNTFIQLTQELANPQDLYNGRNKKRIETIEEKIRIWHETTGNDVIYKEIKVSMTKLCVQFSIDHAELASCNNFLSS